MCSTDTIQYFSLRILGWASQVRQLVEMNLQVAGPTIGDHIMNSFRWSAGSDLCQSLTWGARSRTPKWHLQILSWGPDRNLCSMCCSYSTWGGKSQFWPTWQHVHRTLRFGELSLSGFTAAQRGHCADCGVFDQRCFVDTASTWHGQCPRCFEFQPSLPFVSSSLSHVWSISLVLRSKHQRASLLTTLFGPRCRLPYFWRFAWFACLAAKPACGPWDLILSKVKHAHSKVTVVVIADTLEFEP